MIATEPRPFKEILVNGSELFETEVEIDMSNFIGENRIIEELTIKSQIKRKHEIVSKYKGEKTLKLVLSPHL